MQSTTGFKYDWPFAGSIMNDASSQEDSNARCEKYNAEYNEHIANRKETRLVRCPLCEAGYGFRDVPTCGYCCPCGECGYRTYVCTVCLGKKYIEIEEENKIRKILEDNWSSKSK